MTGDSLEKQILENYPRLTEEDSFTFSCNPDVPCFNNCCADVNIVLTPYDVLRLKRRLGIESGDFLDKYTLMPFHKDLRLPSPILKMQDDEGKACHFVGEQGCTVYEDRPWACRMYPLGLASKADDEKVRETGFYFLLQEDKCKGHGDGGTQTIAEWLDGQGIRPYNEWGETYKALRFHEFFRGDKELDPRQMNMFFLACFDLDAFRRFVFDSTFLRRFEVDDETLDEIRTDDEKLMLFGIKWARFSVFGEADLMTVRPDALPSDQQE
jgi:uncharacterized protein